MLPAQRVTRGTNRYSSLARVVPLREAIMRYVTNRPLVGKAFCPRVGRKGASARLASCSRRLEGL